MVIYNYDVTCVSCGNRYTAKIIKGFVPTEISDDQIRNIERRYCYKCGKEFDVEKDEAIEKSLEPINLDFRTRTFRKMI